MSYLTRSLISASFVAATLLAAAFFVAGTAKADTQFPQGIVTFAFDDGYQSFAENAAPVLDAAGFDASIYIYTDVVGVSESFMSEATLNAMAAAGHDIGGHSKSHPDLTEVTAEVLASEIQSNRSFLQGLSSKPSVTSFAYPFGAFNTDVTAAVSAAGYTAARTVEQGFNFADSDLLTLKTQYVRFSEDTSANVIADIDAAVTNKTWLIITFHEVVDAHPAECVSAEGGDAEECVTTEYLQAIVNYAKDNNVCVLTVAQVVNNTPCPDNGGSGGGGGGEEEPDPNAPSCPEGWTLQSGDCVYTAEPVAPTCPEGYTQNGNECETDAEPVPPTVCPEGYTLEEGGCVTDPVSPTCPENLRFQENVFEGGEDGCVSITPTAPDACLDGEGNPTGATFTNGQCVILIGEPNESNQCFVGTYNADLDWCVAVPPFPADQPSCAEGLVGNGDPLQCYEVTELSCAEGTVYNDETDMCVMEDPIAPACPAGTEEDGDECEYVTIEASVCPAGYTLGAEGCVGDTVEPSCPSGKRLNEAGTQCENIPTSGGSSSSSSSSSGGGGGGGGGGGVVLPVATTTGQVLGATTGTCFQFTRNLSRGMTGNDVMELQKILKAKGHLVIDTPTSLFGPMTQAAVVKFQATNSLEQVGMVGPKTRALLNVCEGGLTDSQKQELIKSLQTQLDILLKKIAELIAAQGN